MADPVSMLTAGSAIVGIGSTIAGTFTQAKGAQDTGAAQSAMYQYKAGVALMNKQIEDQNANWALQSGDVQAEEQGLRSGQNIGQTRAQMAGSGLDVNSGSNARVTDSQQAATQFDQNVIQFNASKAAYGFKAKAAADTAEATMDTIAAGNARTAASNNVTASILGGASSVASKWLQAKNVGLGSGSDSSGDIGVWNGQNWGAPAAYTATEFA